MNWDKIITFSAIIGVILITGLAMFIYGKEGIQVTSQSVTGLLGFAGGGAVGTGVGYMMAKKEGE